MIFKTPYRQHVIGCTTFLRQTNDTLRILKDTVNFLNSFYSTGEHKKRA